jgi:hypothetical protein
MIHTAKEANYKIDWHAAYSEEQIHNDPDKIIADRKHYFDMLRRFLQDIKNLGRDEIDEIFARYNVHFVDIDDIQRVNIDEPQTGG